MSCEIRKSSNLRNVVYEIGKFKTPAAVVVIDATVEDGPAKLEDDLYRKFWYEMQKVFREVGQASDYSLSADVHECRRSMSQAVPILIKLDFDKIAISDYIDNILTQITDLEFKSTILVWIDKLGSLLNTNISRFKLREVGSPTTGVDMISILYN